MAHKIITFDLREAVPNQLEFAWIQEDYGLNETNKNLIRNNLTQPEDQRIERMYIFNNYVFAVYKATNPFTLELCPELSPEQSLNLPRIPLHEVEAYKSVIIDWIFQPHRSSSLTALTLHSMQPPLPNELFIENIRPFYNAVTTLAVEELGFTLKEFFIPMHEPYRDMVQEFRNYYYEEVALSNIHLTTVWIIDNLILGYAFRHEGETYEHAFWNLALEEQLWLLPAMHFREPVKLTLDFILDKINTHGIASLTPEERNFLINTNATS